MNFNYLVVSSANRVAGTTGAFRVQYEMPAQDVSWVELVSATIPWNASFADAGYLGLRISQIRSNVIDSGDNAAAFFIPVGETAATSKWVEYNPVNPQCVTTNDLTLETLDVQLLAGGAVVNPAKDMQFVLLLHRSS